MDSKKNNLGSLFLLYGIDRIAKAEARKKIIAEETQKGSAEVFNVEINPEKDFGRVIEALSKINNFPIFGEERIFVLKIQLEAEQRKGEKSNATNSSGFFSKARCRETSEKLALTIFPAIASLPPKTTLLFDFYFELDAKNDFLIAAKKDGRFKRIEFFKQGSTGGKEGKESFQFAEAVIGGNTRNALYLLEKIIQEQKKSGLDEVAIALNLLGLLAFKTNRMAALKEVSSAGEAKEKIGMAPYFFQQEKNQSDDFSRETLLKLFQKIVSAQQKAKSGLYSPLSLLTTFIFAFSTEKQRRQSV